MSLAVKAEGASSKFGDQGVRLARGCGLCRDGFTVNIGIVNHAEK